MAQDMFHPLHLGPAFFHTLQVHVISYNHPAISLYERMGLQLVRRFPRFYNFHDQVWDSFLYVLYEKGGRPPENLALELLKEEVFAMITSLNSPQALRQRCKVWFCWCRKRKLSKA